MIDIIKHIKTYRITTIKKQLKSVLNHVLQVCDYSHKLLFNRCLDLRHQNFHSKKIKYEK